MSSAGASAAASERPAAAQRNTRSVDGRAAFSSGTSARLGHRLLRDNLLHEIARVYGQAVDLEDLARRRRDGLGPEADQAALSRLLALEHKLAGGETLTAVEFIDYGRLAATIIKEVAGER